MAIIYKWNIPQMNAHIQSDGQDNVIYTVHYRYSGSEESGGKTYSDTNIGVKGFTYVAGEPFVPYENTEAFEAVVIGWLEGSLVEKELAGKYGENSVIDLVTGEVKDKEEEQEQSK